MDGDSCIRRNDRFTMDGDSCIRRNDRFKLVINIEPASSHLPSFCILHFAFYIHPYVGFTGTSI
ncbi:MAG: hypothetical protein NT007_19235 [Candidatus Kapabacteria bacterium]|nr:hypothetical protein [Candidatus Kapabacteria bacterium]